MPQLAGVWLNPRSDKWFNVKDFGDRHELWIYDKDNAKKIGLRDATYKKIAKMNPKKDADPIRITAMEGGLVRMRDNQTLLAVQFSASSYKVREILWSVLMVIKRGEKSYKNTESIWFNNLKYADSIELTAKEFERRLKEDEAILMKESITQEINDVSQKSYNEFVNKG
jgi:hypothetical protein